MRSVEECLNQALRETTAWRTVRQLRIKVGAIRAQQYFSNAAAFAEDEPFLPSDSQTRRALANILDNGLALRRLTGRVYVYRTTHPTAADPPTPPDESAVRHAPATTHTRPIVHIKDLGRPGLLTAEINHLGDSVQMEIDRNDRRAFAHMLRSIYKAGLMATTTQKETS